MMLTNINLINFADGKRLIWKEGIIFGALQFISDEVESVLQDLDVSGPDGIPPIILKNCASAFAKPLSLLFNSSMATSVFPTGGRFHTLGVTTLKAIVT
jgi:hypothetical protein